MTPRRISLSRELDLIRSAVVGARLLLERFNEMPLDLRPLRGLPWSARSALLLIEVRLRDLGRLVDGTADPESIWIKQTAAEGALHPNDEDVCFEWTERRRIQHHRFELRRVKRRRRHHRRQRNRRGRTR